MIQCPFATEAVLNFSNVCIIHNANSQCSHPIKKLLGKLSKRRKEYSKHDLLFLPGEMHLRILARWD